MSSFDHNTVAANWQPEPFSNNFKNAPLIFPAGESKNLLVIVVPRQILRNAKPDNLNKLSSDIKRRAMYPKSLWVPCGRAYDYDLIGWDQ